MTNENETNVEEVELTDQEKEFALCAAHGVALIKLLQYPRFVTFVQTNYEIGEFTQTEDGGVTVSVRERNSAEVQLTLDKMLKDASNKVQIVNESALKDVAKEFKGFIDV